jgi:hypothetical protein
MAIVTNIVPYSASKNNGGLEFDDLSNRTRLQFGIITLSYIWGLDPCSIRSLYRPEP